MTIANFLDESTRQLAAVGIQTSRLDCLILLEDVLEIDRAVLLAYPERTISSAKLVVLNKLVAQRKNHLPLAYIRGKVMFYGHEFLVNEHVLTPRPETETMVQLVKKIVQPGIIVADIGTGSGCIGITIALEMPNANVYLFDIDQAALKVAQKNAEALHVRVHIRQQDLLQNLDVPCDVLTANLPYVPEDYPINEAARHEPRHALFSGSDGLDHYRTFWKGLIKLPCKPAHILTESLGQQHVPLQILAGLAGYRETERKGLIQHFTPQAHSGGHR